ncbi:MAG: D-alanyl-D-alanine carboxypeptidase [Betaproteobacteria bacterium]|nr:D-alanyl-D-alanine carboxypeptidase [Betaproteobacteria bacterium]
MKTFTSSQISIACAITLASLFATPISFAAKQHAAKHGVAKKAEASKKSEASANAVPPLPAQNSLAPNAPAIAAKAWLLMDFDSGELLASANVDEPLPPASLTKMMTSYIVEQALRTGKLKQTDMVSVSQNAWCRGTNTESCMYLPLNSNRNALLYTDPTVDGLKTGHTQEAGYCLVTSSVRNGMRLITVVLNAGSAKSRADETRTLLGWGFSSFEKLTPIQANAVVSPVKVSFGKVDTVPAVLGAPWLVTVPRGQQIQTAVEVKASLEAPLTKGAVVGKVLATSNGKTVSEAPLVAQADVERSGLLLRGWQHVTKLFGK